MRLEPLPQKPQEGNPPAEDYFDFIRYEILMQPNGLQIYDGGRIRSCRAIEKSENSDGDYR